jgi:hypothetical protein
LVAWRGTLKTQGYCGDVLLTNYRSVYEI